MNIISSIFKRNGCVIELKEPLQPLGKIKKGYKRGIPKPRILSSNGEKWELPKN